MAYVIAAPCIADGACIDICPVHCITYGAEQMFIDPDVCIDCGACLDVCPVLAIYDAGSLPEKWRHYADINRDYFGEARR